MWGHAGGSPVTRMVVRECMVIVTLWDLRVKVRDRRILLLLEKKCERACCFQGHLYSPMIVALARKVYAVFKAVEPPQRVSTLGHQGGPGRCVLLLRPGQRQGFLPVDAGSVRA